jgi:hypothetical protein
MRLGPSFRVAEHNRRNNVVIRRQHQFVFGGRKIQPRTCETYPARANSFIARRQYQVLRRKAAVLYCLSIGCGASEDLAKTITSAGAW